MNCTSTASERLADGIIHVLGMVAGVLGVTIMLIAAARLLPPASTAILCVYGAAMLAMLGFSAAYHMTPAARCKDVLRRLDHAAIFLKIAGTYTPFATIKIGGATGYALLGSVWTVALLGATGKLLLASTWDRLAVPLYLALGWAGLLMFKPLAVAVPPAAMVLLGAGGAVYSIGVIFHLWRTLPYRNAAWHLCVLAGTGCHFGAVALRPSPEARGAFFRPIRESANRMNSRCSSQYPASSGERGVIILRQKLSRRQLDAQARRFAAPCLVGMEACVRDRSGTQANLDRRSHDPGLQIQARQQVPAR